MDLNEEPKQKQYVTVRFWSLCSSRDFQSCVSDMAPKKRPRTNENKKIAELGYDKVAAIADYIEPDLASVDETKDLDFNTLILLLSFMIGWHPMHIAPETLGDCFNPNCMVYSWRYANRLVVMSCSVAGTPNVTL